MIIDLRKSVKNYDIKDKRNKRRNMMTTYKPAKNAQEQIEYLKTNKKITFNSIHEQQARDILFKYNYINVITPYKHHFSKFDKDGNEVKIDGKHIYERDIEF
mgnify:CR=1 FL=1